MEVVGEDRRSTEKHTHCRAKNERFESMGDSYQVKKLKYYTATVVLAAMTLYLMWVNLAIGGPSITYFW